MTLPDTATLANSGLRLDVDGPVATVTLAKPERRNCQTPSMWHALAAIGAGLGEDTRVVVVKGEGPSFSAGIDVAMFTPEGVPGEVPFSEMLAQDDEGVAATIAGYQEGFTWLRDERWISVAAVHGHAIGAGFQLALACDLRVVAEDTRFCMKEPALGLVPDLAGTKPLVELVGYARALEMCATARVVGADEADRIGLATMVAGVDRLGGAVADLVAAVLTSPAGAVRETKALLRDAADRVAAEQDRAEREAQGRRFRTMQREGRF